MGTDSVAMPPVHEAKFLVELVSSIKSFLQDIGETQRLLPNPANIILGITPSLENPTPQNDTFLSICESLKTDPQQVLSLANYVGECLIMGNSNAANLQRMLADSTGSLFKSKIELVRSVVSGHSDEAFIDHTQEVLRNSAKNFTSKFFVLIEPFGNKWLDPSSKIEKVGGKVHFQRIQLRSDTSMDNIIDHLINLAYMVEINGGVPIILPPFPRLTKKCCPSHMSDYNPSEFLEQISEMGDYLVRTPRLQGVVVLHLADLFRNGDTPPYESLLSLDSIHWSQQSLKCLVNYLRDRILLPHSNGNLRAILPRKSVMKKLKDRSFKSYRGLLRRGRANQNGAPEQ